MDDDSLGSSASARPHQLQIESGSRPPSADAAPSDLSLTDTLPVLQNWRDRLISAYASDPWFFAESHLEQLTLDESLWYHVDGKVVMPASTTLRCKLISDFHDNPYVGHVGINETTRLLSRYYHWLSMDANVAQYVRECHFCQTNKARQAEPLGALQPLELPLVPCECVRLDFITKLPFSSRGHDAIMVVVNAHQDGAYYTHHYNRYC